MPPSLIQEWSLACSICEKHAAVTTRHGQLICGWCLDELTNRVQWKATRAPSAPAAPRVVPLSPLGPAAAGDLILAKGEAPRGRVILAWLVRGFVLLFWLPATAAAALVSVLLDLDQWCSKVIYESRKTAQPRN